MDGCSEEDIWVEVSGGQVFVRRWLPKTVFAKTPIVLLHDSLGCVRLWRHFPATLALQTGRAVYAYDRLGFGASDARSAPLSLQFIDEEAEVFFPQVCRELGLWEVIVLGHSVGGCMALASAAQSGEPVHCEAVISIAAQAFVEERTLHGIRDAKQQFRKPGQMDKLGRLHGEKAQWVLDAWTETWLAPGFSGWNLDSHLGNVRCPTLIIHGDQDEFGSCAFPERIASGVAGDAELHILPGCGHVPHREKSEEVLHLVRNFLRGA